MSVIFLLLHVGFAVAFLFVGSIVGGLVFVILGLIAFFYFHPVFHAMGRARFGDRFAHPIGMDLDSQALKERGVFFLRQASFYLAFFLLYGSVAGISRALHWDFAEISLGFSMIVTALAIGTRRQANITTYLLLRSNYIVCGITYALFFSYLLLRGGEPSAWEAVNIFVALVGLGGIVLLDPLLDEGDRANIYVGFLFLFLFIIFFFVEFFFSLPRVSLALDVIIVGGAVFAEWCYHIPFLEAFEGVSARVGTLLVYAGFFVTFSMFLLGNTEMNTLILLAIVFSFHLAVYVQKVAFGSFLTLVAITMAFYAFFFVASTAGSFVASLVFALGLPCAFIILSYFFPFSAIRDIYLLHSFALLFAVGSYVYSAAHASALFLSVFALSTFAFLVSLLLFAVFLRYQRRYT